jgi:ferredoxin
VLRVVSVAIFVLVLIAGFFGTAYPERNFATTFVWNVWWPLVVVSVFFIGTAWCAVCPWDALASWVVRLRLWRRANPHPGLNRKVPSYLRGVWVALILFMGFTWLELGVGITFIPYATAALAVLMLGLAITFLLFFEKKAFCRYACPVGRTLGFYSRLAPIAVRPVVQATCDSCKTLECYRGSETIEPCPSSLTVGRFSQNTFCTSCGNCALSCPHQNVSWRLRTMGSEAKEPVTSHWDATWFMLALLGITSFHGLTMIPQWRDGVMAIAAAIGEMGQVFMSFTLAMAGGFALPVVLYGVATGLMFLVCARSIPYARLFTSFSFTALPLAFAYHLAHNMSHLFQEGAGFIELLANPLGTGLEPLSSAERHEQMMNTLLPEDMMFTLQAGLMVFGFFLAVQIARYQWRRLAPAQARPAGMRLLPMLFFIAAITLGNLWLMAQDMEMRF